MVEFTICLAGLVVSIHALCESTMHFCHEYVIDGSTSKPDIEIIMDNKDLENEKMIAADNLMFEGRDLFYFSEEELERSALYRKIGEELPRFGGFVFHGSAVAVSGMGFIFSAPSGTGKSTHAKLWKKALGKNVLYINDDKPIILFKEEVPYVFGSPWDGKHHRSNNIGVPLKGISFLKRSQNNRIEKIDRTHVFPLLLQQAYRPRKKDMFMVTLSILDCLSERIPMFLLECNMEPESARVAFDGMYNG